MSLSPSTLRVAIVGSGPARLCAVAALHKAAPEISAVRTDRRPTPFCVVTQILASAAVGAIPHAS